MNFKQKIKKVFPASSSTVNGRMDKFETIVFNIQSAVENLKKNAEISNSKIDTTICDIKNSMQELYDVINISTDELKTKISDVEMVNKYGYTKTVENLKNISTKADENLVFFNEIISNKNKHLKLPEIINDGLEYNILFTPSGELWKATLVCMLSLIENCTRKINFYILESDWSNEQKIKLIDVFKSLNITSINFIHVEEKQWHYFIPYSGHYQMYYYLLAHEMIKNIDRLLCLNVDIIITKDIYKLYTTDFENNYLSACEDNCSVKFSDKKKVVEKHRAPHFLNSGMVLLNLKKFRDNNITQDFYLNNVKNMIGDYTHADQGILSFCFWDKIKYLPAICYNYNCYNLSFFNAILSTPKQERIGEFHEVYDNDIDLNEVATVIHFTGGAKPWDVIITPENNVIDFGSTQKKMAWDKYYMKWWTLAKLLPKEIYTEICNDSVKYFQLLLTSKDNSVNVLRNSLNREKHKSNYQEKCTKLYKRMLGDEMIDLIHYLQEKDAVIALLKTDDLAGQILLSELTRKNIPIIFKTSKGSFDELNETEFELCSKADIIINAFSETSAPVLGKGLTAISVRHLLNRVNGLKYLNKVFNAVRIKNINTPQFRNDMKKICDLQSYFQFLNEIKSDFLIIAAIKDVAGICLPNDVIEQMHNFGFTKFVKESWVTYIGVSYQSEILFNQCGEKLEAPIEYSNSQINIEIKSMALRKGNTASIKISDKEYAINKRGINFVVYDLKNQTLVDSVAFDYHDRICECYRE